MSRKQRPPSLGLPTPGLPGSALSTQSTEPLVSLSKTVVECRPESDRPYSLSSKASCFFDIQSFPSSVELLPARSQFELLFDIPPPRSAAPHTFRVVLNESDELCLDHTRTPFSAAPDLLMSLRRLSDDKLLDKLSDRLSGDGSSNKPSGNGSPNKLSSDKSSNMLAGNKNSDKLSDELRFDPNELSCSSKDGSSPESLLASATSLASDASARSEHETARAAREAMDTPLGGHPQKPRHAVQLLGRSDDCPKALTATIAGELRSTLPVQQRLAKSWRLVYSMDQHGISFHTMLSSCENEKSLLLAIKDTNGRVFGAFLNEPLRLSPTFYGQGTSFLWKAFRSSPQSRRKDAVRCFKYSGANEYFILCDPDFVAIGGGRGKFGLWFKSDFLHGNSARCPTFNNEPLCLDPANPLNHNPDAQQEFVVGHLELWAFNT